MSRTYAHIALIMRLAVASLVVGLLTMTTSTAVAQSKLKVGVVDFTRALEATESEGALQRLKTDVTERQTALKALEDEILGIEQELQESGPMLSEEKMKEAVMAYQKKAYEYRQKLLVSEKEFESKKAKVLGEIHRVMEEIAVEIAQEEKLDFMVEKNEGAVVYFNASFDYTDALIKRYRARRTTN